MGLEGTLQNNPTLDRTLFSLVLERTGKISLDYAPGRPWRDPVRILGRTLEVFPPPCDVAAVQGSVGLWEASLRADFSWSIPAWSVYESNSQDFPGFTLPRVRVRL